MATLVPKTANIASGASLSSAIDLTFSGATPVAIIMPAAWTTAGLTFQASFDGGVTFTDLYTLVSNASTEYAITSPAALQVIQLPAAPFANVQQLKIRSGTGASAVNQTSARAITVVTV